MELLHSQTLSSLHHHLRRRSSRAPPSTSFLLIRRPTSLGIPSTSSSRRPVPPLKAASNVDGTAAPSPSIAGGGGRSLDDLLRTFLPGGSWWKLPHEEGRGDWDQNGSKAVVVSVPFAFRRMWELLRDDKWIVFAGFTVLILAAVLQSALSLSFIFFFCPRYFACCGWIFRWLHLRTQLVCVNARPILWDTRIKYFGWYLLV